MSSENVPSNDDNTPEIRCAEVLGQGTWKRMDGDELRWVWQGDRSITPQELLGETADVQTFPSATGNGSIAICVLDDGGLVSYQRDNGEWLHTINGVSAFRYKVYELNVVPIEELGVLLKRTDEIGLPDEAV